MNVFMLVFLILKDVLLGYALNIYILYRMISVKLFDLILKTVQTNNNYIFMFKVEEPSYYEVWGGSETDYDQQILDDNYLNTGYMSPYGWILYNTFGSPQINYQKTYTQSPLPYTQSYFTYSQYPVTYSQYPVTYSQTTTTTSTSITTTISTTATSTTKVEEYLLPIKETTTTTKTTTSSTTEEPHFRKITTPTTTEETYIRKITTPTTTEETYIRKITTPVSIEDTTLGEATETMETTNAIIDDIVGTTIEEEEFTTLDSLNEKLIDSIEIYTTEINEEITIATIAIAEDTSEDSINFSVTEESSVGILEPVFDKDTGKNVFKFL